MSGEAKRKKEEKRRKLKTKKNPKGPTKKTDPDKHEGRSPLCGLVLKKSKAARRVKM